MPKYSRNIIIKVTDSPATVDRSVDTSLALLQEKTGADVYHIDNLPKLDGDDVKGARIYIHGHGDYYNNAFGGRQPEAVAQKLIDANLTDAKLVSLTGCNSARGNQPRATAQRVWNEVYEKYEARERQQLMEHLTGQAPHPQDRVNPPVESEEFGGIRSDNLNARCHTDSRLVDTTLTATELCLGSFAQQFHKALNEGDRDIDVHARLYVVNIERGENGVPQKMTEHTLVQEFEGVISTFNKSVHHAEKSKIKISKCGPTDGGVNNQQFAYVDYPAEQADDAAGGASAAGGVSGADPAPVAES